MKPFDLPRSAASCLLLGTLAAAQVGDVPGLPVGCAVGELESLELDRVFAAPYERFADAVGQSIVLYTVQDFAPGEHFERQQPTIARMNALDESYGERGLCVIALLPYDAQRCADIAAKQRVTSPYAPFHKVGGKWAPVQERLGSQRLRSGVLLSPVLAIRGDEVARWQESGTPEFLEPELEGSLVPPMWKWGRGTLERVRDELGRGFPARALEAAAEAPGAAQGVAAVRASLERAIELDVRFLQYAFASGRYDLAQRIAERQECAFAGSDHGARAKEVLAQLAEDPALRAQLEALSELERWDELVRRRGLDLELSKKLRREVSRLIAGLPDVSGASGASGGYAKAQATKLLERLERYDAERCARCGRHPEDCKC